MKHTCGCSLRKGKLSCAELVSSGTRGDMQDVAKGMRPQEFYKFRDGVLLHAARLQCANQHPTIAVACSNRGTVYHVCPRGFASIYGLNYASGAFSHVFHVLVKTVNSFCLVCCYLYSLLQFRGVLTNT